LARNKTVEKIAQAKGLTFAPDVKPEKIKLKFSANCAYKFISVSNGDIVELDKEQADYCLNRGKCKVV
jgi:hypothetical protein